MFKKILFVLIVVMFIGCDFNFTNKTADIPSGSSVTTTELDTSSVVPDSIVVKFIKQFNEFNTDTSCKIIDIESRHCFGHERGSFTDILVKCYSLSNYEFPQNVEVFYKEESITDMRPETNVGVVRVSFTRYTNKKCVYVED